MFSLSLLIIPSNLVKENLKRVKTNCICYQLLLKLEIQTLNKAKLGDLCEFGG